MDTSNLPVKPGVYMFKNYKSKIIYVGKAKNIKKRVKSYFSKGQKSAKTRILAKNAKTVDYFITNNEVEALLLENKYIKRHSPKYNITLKDDKTYAYIKITEEKLPKIVSTRRIGKTGTYFGPYPKGYSRANMVKLLNNHFQLCRKKCSRDKTCLNYHLKQCKGANIGKETPEEYNERVEQAKQVLKGDYKDIEESLREELEKHSKNQNYELAMQKRDLLESIDILRENQNVDDIKKVNQDVIGIKHEKDYTNFIVLHIEKGTILGKENYKVEKEDMVESKFLTSYYYKGKIPHEILVSDEFWSSQKEKEILQKYLESLSKRRVYIKMPKRGDKKSLVELAMKNIKKNEEETLKKIKEKLSLRKTPRIIECFDVSNLKDEFIVGGMVRWIDGKPNKSGYRRFKIRTKTTQDDFQGMKEMVKRRYKRLKEEERKYPDLVMIDGGVGQVRAALKALEEVRVDVEVVGLAKKEETIVKKDGSKINLDKKNAEMLLIRKIRDSAHRFALSYNKQLRRKNIREGFD